MTFMVSLLVAIRSAAPLATLWFAWGKRITPTWHDHLEMAFSIGLLVGAVVFALIMPPQDLIGGSSKPMRDHTQFRRH